MLMLSTTDHERLCAVWDALTDEVRKRSAGMALSQADIDDNILYLLEKYAGSLPLHHDLETKLVIMAVQDKWRVYRTPAHLSPKPNEIQMMRQVDNRSDALHFALEVAGKTGEAVTER